MAKKVELDFGAGWVDYSAYLKVNPSVLPVIRERSVYNADWKPNANTVKLTFERNIALYNAIVSTPIDIPLKITEDGTTPLFTGFIRRSGQISVSQTRVEGFEVEGIDAWMVKLDRKCRSEIYLTTPAICNPTTPANSILHVLFTAAGFTSAELVGLVAITPTIPQFTVAADKTTFRALVEKLLFEFGYSAYIDEEGIVRLYDLGPESITATETIFTGAGGNLSGQGTIKPDEISSEAVDVSYWTTKTLTAAILFEETQGAVGSLACSIPLTAGQYHPDGSSATVDMYAEYKIDGYELIGVNAASVLHLWNHTGHVVRDSFAPGALKALLKFHSDTGGVIIQNKITGTALVRDTQNFIRRENVAGTDKRESIECEYVADETNAQRLAVIRANRLKNSVYKFQFFSTDLTLYPGEYVNFSDTVLTGITGIHRIVTIRDVDSKTVQILTEPVTEFTWDAVTGDGLVPPHNDTQAQITNLATVAREASVSLRLSTRSATWNRALVVSPANLTASAKYADGTNYLGIFQTALSHDGVTYVVAYTSAAPESSHVYAIPALMDIGGVMYHVVAIREILFDPTGTINKATEYIALTPDVSVAPVHFGPLATPPASGMLPNDDYFDTRASGSGGGKLYYWTGSAWAEMTSAHPQYFAAVSANMTAMIDWCNDNAGTIGDVSAFITALFENIIAQTAMIAKIATSTVYSAALCDDGVTQRMTIDLDNAILTARSADQSKTIKLFDSILRSQEGANVLDHEGQSLIWRLASTLSELARIQYDPTSGQIRLSKAAVPVEFKGSWIAGTWGSATDKTIVGVDGSLCPLPDGTTRYLYRNNGDNHIYEIIISSAGVFGTATDKGIAGAFMSQCLLPNGSTRVIYQSATSPYATYQVMISSAGAWGTPEAKSFVGYEFCQCLLPDGTTRFLYQADGTSNVCEIIISSSNEWGTVTDKGFPAVYISQCLLSDGTTRFVYNYGTVSEIIISSTGTWGLANSKSINGDCFSQCLLPNGSERLLYRNIADNHIHEIIISSTGLWGTAIDKTVTAYWDISQQLLPNGSTRILYWASTSPNHLYQIITTDAYTTIPLKTAYAPLGMEIGENPNGIYIRIPLLEQSDGSTLGIQACWTWGYIRADGVNYHATNLYTFPAAFSSNVALHQTTIGYKTGSAPTSQYDNIAEATHIVPLSRLLSNTQYRAGYSHDESTVLDSSYYFVFSISATGLYTEAG